MPPIGMRLAIPELLRQVAHNRLSGAFTRGSVALTGRAEVLCVACGAAVAGWRRARRRWYGPSVGAWSQAAIDECGEAVEQALQPELEQVLQIEIVVGSGEAFEDGEAACLHD